MRDLDRIPSSVHPDGLAANGSEVFFIAAIVIFDLMLR